MSTTRDLHPMTVTPPRPESRRSDLGALGRSARRELTSFEPRLSLALALAGALPPYTATPLRVQLLRAGGLVIGEQTVVGGKVWVAGGRHPGRRIEIGAECFVNDGCRFDVSAPIRIGDRVYFGHDAAVLTASHAIGGPSQRAGASTADPVVIGSGSWIGARATILGGVTVGEGAMVAAGAVVIRSVPANTLVGGVPAKVIRSLDD